MARRLSCLSLSFVPIFVCVTRKFSIPKCEVCFNKYQTCSSLLISGRWSCMTLSFASIFVCAAKRFSISPCKVYFKKHQSCSRHAPELWCLNDLAWLLMIGKVEKTTDKSMSEMTGGDCKSRSSCEWKVERLIRENLLQVDNSMMSKKRAKLFSALPTYSQ